MSLLLRHKHGRTQGNRLLQVEGPRGPRFSRTPSSGARGISSRGQPDPWTNMPDRYFAGIDREWNRRFGK